MDDCNCEKYHRLEDARWAAHDKVHEVDREVRNDVRREVERRLTEMNQMRDQINTERGIYVRRDYYDTQHNNLRDLLDDLRRTVWLATGGVAALSFMLTLGAAWLRHP